MNLAASLLNPLLQIQIKITVSNFKSRLKILLRYVSYLCHAEGNIEFEGKQNLTVSRGTSHLLFCYTSQLKNRKKIHRNCLLDAGWPTNLPWFQGARPDHVRVESSNCCFPRELVSFGPQHVACSLPIEKRI